MQSYPGFRLVADATTQYRICKRGVRYGLHIAGCDSSLLVIAIFVESCVSTEDQRLVASLLGDDGDGKSTCGHLLEPWGSNADLRGIGQDETQQHPRKMR